MRYLVLLLIFFQGQLWANMAEPVTYGTLGGRPFVSKHVNIEHEDLHIKINTSFDTAQYNIQYHIESDLDGDQIPLIFLASEYLDSFKVRLDGKEIPVKNGNDYDEIPFEKISCEYPNLINDENNNTYSNSFLLDNFNDKIYFEVDLSKGKHVIDVSYKGSNWIDGWELINKYSFRYNLKPAKLWKSFGTLDIVIDAEDFGYPFSTNTDKRVFQPNSIIKLSFDSLPVDELEIIYQPEISKLGNMILNIGHSRIAFCLSLVFALLHLRYLVNFRKKQHQKFFSRISILLSIVVPISFVLFDIGLYSLINYEAGNHFSGGTGYHFMYLFFFPLVIFIYLITAEIIDKLIRLYYLRKNSIVKL